MSVLFFDIGATLADARVEPDGSLTLRPRPRVVAVLDAFRDVRKGIISNPGPGDGADERAAAALEEAFPGRFTDASLVHWGVKDSRRLFDLAVASTGVRRPTTVCSWARMPRRGRSRGRRECVRLRIRCSPSPRWRTVPCSSRGSGCRTAGACRSWPRRRRRPRSFPCMWPRTGSCSSWRAHSVPKRSNAPGSPWTGANRWRTGRPS